MRWVRDLFAIVAVLGLACAAVHLERGRMDFEKRVGRTTSDLARMEQELAYRAATGSVEINGRGWPTRVEPSWWDRDAPKNWLADDARPWVEIASVEQANLAHPPVRLLLDADTAAIWYNPYRGIVRARVPVMLSDQRSLELYNRVNRAVLVSIFQAEPPVTVRGMLRGSEDTPEGELEREVPFEEQDMDPRRPIVRGEP